MLFSELFISFLQILISMLPATIFLVGGAIIYILEEGFNFFEKTNISFNDATLVLFGLVFGSIIFYI